MNPHSSREWLAALAQLSVEDLRRISRFVDLFVSAERPAAETAQTMLDAQPGPFDYDEARDRLETIIGHLERERIAS